MIDDVLASALADSYGLAPDSDDYVPFDVLDEAVRVEMDAGEAAEIAAFADIDDVPSFADLDESVLDDESVLADEELAARGLAVAADMPKDGRLRWWELVVWSDSVVPDWAARWSARPDVRGLAIWHDMDVKSDTGELKKKHMHCMAGDSRGRKWSLRQALRFGQDVFGLRPGLDDGLVRPIKSPSGYALYLTHSNAPNKHQYSRDAVMSFGGADLDMVIGVVDNERSILSDIYAWIDSFYARYHVLPAFAAIVRYADAMRPAWSRVLASSRARVVRSYLQSYEYDEGVDGRGAGTLRIVRGLIADEKKAAKLLGK